MFRLRCLLPIFLFASPILATVKTSEDNSTISISNDRLSFSVNKTSGSISKLLLDGQNILGTGQGPYLDCHFTNEGFWQPGNDATYKVFEGSDGTGKAYSGAVMSQGFRDTGKKLQQHWFLRDDETGIHVFARASYSNSTVPTGGDLGEMRQLFRPKDSVWTHLSSSDEIYAPLPNTDGAPVVQDATWYVGGQKDSPYVQQMSDYFTKYMFSETWRDHEVHGLFGDGSKSDNGTAFGAWLIMNTKDTYYNGPTHSDLTVDGIVYNYLVSNHHGNGVLEMINGYDRTFGPVLLLAPRLHSLADLVDSNTITSIRDPKAQPCNSYAAMPSRLQAVIGMLSTTRSLSMSPTLFRLPAAALLRPPFLSLKVQLAL